MYVLLSGLQHSFWWWLRYSWSIMPCLAPACCMDSHGTCFDTALYTSSTYSIFSTTTRRPVNRRGKLVRRLWPGKLWHSWCHSSWTGAEQGRCRYGVKFPKHGEKYGQKDSRDWIHALATHSQRIDTVRCIRHQNVSTCLWILDDCSVTTRRTKLCEYMQIQFNMWSRSGDCSARGGTRLHTLAQ